MGMNGTILWARLGPWAMPKVRLAPPRGQAKRRICQSHLEQKRFWTEQINISIKLLTISSQALRTICLKHLTFLEELIWAKPMIGPMGFNCFEMA